MSSQYALSQIPYAIFVIALFVGYGILVRRRVFEGRNILLAGAVVGVLAVAAATLNALPQRTVLPLPLLLINPLMMGIVTVYCVWFSYRQQRVEDVATLAVGDTKVIVRVCSAFRIPDADALLLPTSTAMRMLGGVPGAIGIASGGAAEREARQSAPVGMGKVIATSGGRLAVARIFHVAVYDAGRGVDENALRKGVESAAQQARKSGAESVVLPVGAYRPLSAARVAAVVAEGVLKQRRAFAEIVFVALEPRDADAIVQAVTSAVEAAQAATDKGVDGGDSAPAKKRGSR